MPRSPARFTQADARLKCCVPFCNRTTKRSLPYDEDQETLCGPHACATSLRLRKLHTAARKKCVDIMDQYPEPDDAPLEIIEHGLRFARLEKWLWKKLKAAAIEAAGGIG